MKNSDLIKGLQKFAPEQEIDFIVADDCDNYDAELVVNEYNGSVELVFQLPADYEILTDKNIIYRNICLEWLDDYQDVKKDFLMIDENVSNETIQEVVNEALESDGNQGDEFRFRLRDRGIAFKEFEYDTFDFN